MRPLANSGVELVGNKEEQVGLTGGRCQWDCLNKSLLDKKEKKSHHTLYDQWPKGDVMSCLTFKWCLNSSKSTK